MNAGLLWLAVAVALAVGEALAGELFLLMLAGGALGAAGAALVGVPLWGQGLAFALVSVLLVGVVRPLARRRMLAALPEHDSGAAALVGRPATVVEQIGAETGLIEIGGDTWTARPVVDGESIPAGEKVWIERIDGATARVLRGP